MEAGKWVEKKRKNNKGNRKPRESHLEPGIQGFCKFLVQESKLKDKMVLIFYTKFEMCAFLTRIKQLYFYQQQFWELGLQRGEKTIGLLQNIGVDYSLTNNFWLQIFYLTNVFGTKNKIFL